LQDDGAAPLREFVEEEARDLQGEAFTRFMDTLFERVALLVNRGEVADNLGAVRAIDQLIAVQLGENATKISRFANYLRQIFEEKTDPAVMVAASAALGHLAREGGALTADVVEFQVRRGVTVPDSTLKIFPGLESNVMNGKMRLWLENGISRLERRTRVQSLKMEERAYTGKGAPDRPLAT
jgi:hypothetical protein